MQNPLLSHLDQKNLPKNSLAHCTSLLLLIDYLVLFEFLIYVIIWKERVNYIFKENENIQIDEVDAMDSYFCITSNQLKIVLFDVFIHNLYLRRILLAAPFW
jgi:hypothetical protein